MLFAFRYASRLPYQIFVLGAVLNMIIIFSFVFGIRKIVRRMQVVGRPQGNDGVQTELQYGFSDERRLKLLWIGVGTYSLIFLNGLRLGFTYANSIPLPALIFGELLNGGILATFIFEVRKVQRSIRQKQTDARRQTGPTKVSAPD